MGSIGKKLSDIKKLVHSEDKITFIVPQKEPMLFNAIILILTICNQRCRFVLVHLKMILH